MSERAVREVERRQLLPRLTLRGWFVGSSAYAETKAVAPAENVLAVFRAMREYGG